MHSALARDDRRKLLSISVGEHHPLAQVFWPGRNNGVFSWPADFEDVGFAEGRRALRPRAERFDD